VNSNPNKIKTTYSILSIILLITLILSLIFLFTACSSSPNKNSTSQEIKPVIKTNFLMGTLVKITIFDEDYDKNPDDNIFNLAFNRIQEIENKMTINKDNSGEINKLNKYSGIDFIQLSPETYYVLEKGKYYSELSQGKFDITIGPIVKLWNIDTENETLPAQENINKILPLVDYTKLTLDPETKKAKLLTKDMMVDLGAIAKGYAADEAAKVLTDAGVKHAIINLGGNILTVGTKPDGSHWRLGLQDPYKPRNENMGVVKLNNQSLVSSGTYEKYFDVDGKRYHHILDPQTGYPAENELVSVSIITEKSIDADALSTSIFLLGLDDGKKKVEDLDGVEAIFITHDKKVYVTSGINKDNFELINEEYKLQK